MNAKRSTRSKLRADSPGHEFGLASAVADEFEKGLGAYTSGKLPTVSSLSRHFKVSRVTMLKAVHILSDRGRLVVCRGHGIRIRTNNQTEPLQADDTARTTGQPKACSIRAVERLFEKIRDAILNGTFRAGNALPKSEHFVATKHVSNKTVLGAYRQLVTEKLAYRIGKRWIVGQPRSMLIPGTSHSSQPLVLMLLHKENAWNSLCSSSRTVRFTSSFAEEAENFGVEIFPVFTGATMVADPFVSGIEQVRSCIAEAGDRYKGVLVPCSLSEIPDLGEWAQLLARYRKPIVWFDRYDEGGRVQEQLPENVFRTHYDERAAVSLALSSLHSLGHRLIGIPNAHSADDSWVRNRGAMMEKIAREFSDPMRVMPAVIGPAKYPPDIDDKNGSAYVRWKNKGLPHVRRILESLDKSHTFQTAVQLRLVYLSPILMPYLQTPGLSAIMAPNDNQAQGFYYWMKAAGIDIPGEISIISFDNSPQLHPVPVTSVDFGFGYLGYCAFHLLMQDIPIRHSRSRTIGARCHLVHRNSIGLPRRGPLKADLRGEWW